MSITKKTSHSRNPSKKRSLSSSTTKKLNTKTAKPAKKNTKHNTKQSTKKNTKRKPSNKRPRTTFKRAVGITAAGAAIFASMYAAYRNKVKLRTVLKSILKRMSPAQKKSIVNKCNDSGVKGKTPEAIANKVDTMTKETAKEIMQKMDAKKDKTSAEKISTTVFRRYGNAILALGVFVLSMICILYFMPHGDAGSSAVVDANVKLMAQLEETRGKLEKTKAQLEETERQIQTQLIIARNPNKISISDAFADTGKMLEDALKDIDDNNFERVYDAVYIDKNGDIWNNRYKTEKLGKAKSIDFTPNDFQQCPPEWLFNNTLIVKTTGSLGIGFSDSGFSDPYRIRITKIEPDSVLTSHVNEGDYIVEINGISVKNTEVMTQEKIVEMMESRPLTLVRRREW